MSATPRIGSPREKHPDGRCTLTVPDNKQIFYVSTREKRSNVAFWRAFSECYNGDASHWSIVRYQCRKWWVKVRDNNQHERHQLYKALNDELEPGWKFDDMLDARSLGIRIPVVQLLADFLDIRIIVLAQESPSKSLKILSRGQPELPEFYLYRKDTDDWNCMRLLESKNLDADGYKHAIPLVDQTPLGSQRDDPQGHHGPPRRLSYRPAGGEKTVLPKMQANEIHETAEGTETSPWNVKRYVATDRLDENERPIKPIEPAPSRATSDNPASQNASDVEGIRAPRGFRFKIKPPRRSFERNQAQPGTGSGAPTRGNTNPVYNTEQLSQYMHVSQRNEKDSLVMKLGHWLGETGNAVNDLADVPEFTETAFKLDQAGKTATSSVSIGRGN